MNKSTLFFSHSSKDKEIIMPIKIKIEQLTGNVFDIFMSSDGQSIPFGSNWVHKIETGLQEAKIMFVFVTETSLSSGWIYFEAGFAYSKGIQVIPVGMGVNIGDLNPPLNLLQGFNLTSGDSLNNFISIINRTFDCTFPENFSDSDYTEIIRSVSEENYRPTHFDKVISYANIVLYSNKSSDSDTLFDADKCFENILNYLDDNSIVFSKQSGFGLYGKDISVVTHGVKLIYHKADSSFDTLSGKKDKSSIKLNISPLNFQMSFDFLKCLMPFFDKENLFLKFHFRESYSCISSIEDISSMMSSRDNYIPSKEYANVYLNNINDLAFSIFRDIPDSKKDDFSEYVIAISHISETCDSKNIINLIEELYNIGIIHEK